MGGKKKTPSHAAQKKAVAKKKPVAKRKKPESEDDDEELSEEEQEFEYEEGGRKVKKPLTVESFECPGVRMNMISVQQLQNWKRKLNCKFYIDQALHLEQEDYELENGETDKVVYMFIFVLYM